MNVHFDNHRLAALLATVGFAALGAAPAEAQFVFSIDYGGFTISTPDSFTLVPITEGDLLTPMIGVPSLGPLPTPGIDVSAGVTGLGLLGHAFCVGHPPNTPCRVELDAVSYGQDYFMDPAVGILPNSIWFSTDTFAGGVPAGPAPTVNTEAPCADLAADVFGNGVGMPPGPIPPFGFIGGNRGLIDGDGMASLCGIVYPGVGLLEPSWPTGQPVGDNIDALNFDGFVAGGGFGFPATGVYYSLDGFNIHPITGVPGAGTAPGHGFSAADVIHTAAPGGVPTLWAPAPLLGLDLTGAMDDLDALAIAENGSGAFEPSLQPYDWLAGGTDMVLFSVRIGSPVIGMPDSIFGLPIAAGDILTTPLPTAMGGVSPFPGIFIAAENLDLLTARSFGALDDDLNALDIVKTFGADCNGNGIDDLLDLAMGTSTDINGNGVPDDCELIGGPVCFCPAVVAPCGNAYPPGGCMNSTTVGGLLLGAGTTSVTLDNLLLTASQLPINQFGLFFHGASLIGPFTFGDGLRCVGGGIQRFGNVMNTGATGTLTIGPGIAATAGIVPVTTRHFQCWYRDPGGPCGTSFNTTNAFSATFTP